MIGAKSYENENIRLTQKMKAILYDFGLPTIKNIYEDSELQEDSTIRKFPIVQNDGEEKTRKSEE